MNKSKVKKNIIIVTGIVFVIAIIILAFFVFKKNNFGRVINDEFENKSQLVTQVERITIVKDTSKDKTLFKNLNIPGVTSRSIFSYDVVVEAGIDFSNVKYISQDNGTKTITIELPHAQILNANEDKESLETYIDSDGFINNMNMEEKNELMKEMVGEAKERAKTKGKLIEYADENAQRLIESMIKSNDELSEYTIEFQYIEE